MVTNWFNQGGSSSDDAIHYKWREAFDFYPFTTTEHDVSSAAVFEAHVILNDGEPSHVPDKLHTRIGMIDTYCSEVRDEYLCVDQSKNYEEDWRFYPMSISAIYPSYRTHSEKSKDSELLLGVGFPPVEDKKETTRRKTFQRFYVRSDMQERESFDITEDYLMATEIERLFGRAKCYQDPTLILYVCRGARLVVCDVRFSVFESPGSRDVEKHCRSLYQQGSVVIVKGVLQLAICTKEEKLNKKPKQGLVQEYSQRLIEGNIYR